MKITFLGTGGGRFLMYRQIRGTGGFILELDGEMIHVDPGPGASLRAKMYNIDLEMLTGIAVSHFHLEHATETNVIVEAMTKGAFEKKGFLVAGKGVIEGDDKGNPPVLPRYHLKAPEKVMAMSSGDEFNTGKIKIRATPTKHGDDNAVGFVFSGSMKVGYISDTMYFEGLEKHFEGSDILVINTTYGKEYPEVPITLDHLRTSDAEKIIKHVKPKAVIFTHFGREINENAQDEAERIQKNTSIITMAAKDGMVFEL